MEAVLFAVAGFVLIAAGSGATLLLLPRSHRLTFVELLSLSILFGSAFISLTSFLTGLVVRGWPLRAVVTLGALALFFRGWIAKRRVELVWWPVHSRLDWLVAVVLIIQFVLVVWASLRLAMGFDGLFLWDFKAQLIHVSNGVMPVEYFSAAPARFPYPDYPLLVPLTDSWFYGWMGNSSQAMRKLIPPAFYFAVVGSLVSSGARIGGNKMAGTIPAVLFFFVPSVVLRTAAGEADLPVAAFYVASVAFLLEYWMRGDSRLLLMAGALGGMLPWVKREGILLWLCLMGVAFVSAVMRRHMRAFIQAAAPGLLWYVSWRIFLLLVHATTHPDFVPVSWKTINENSARIPQLLRTLMQELANLRNWSFTWLIPAVGVVRLFYGSRRSLTLAWLVLICLPAALYCSIYIFSSWEPFTDHMTASLARLLLHLAPVALLGIAVQFSVLNSQPAVSGSSGSD